MLIVKSGKVLEPMLKQSSYKQALMLSLEEVKKSVDRNKDEAARCLARRVADQGYRISETYNNSEQSLTLLRSIFERLQVGTNHHGGNNCRRHCLTES